MVVGFQGDGNAVKESVVLDFPTPRHGGIRPVVRLRNGEKGGACIKSIDLPGGPAYLPFAIHRGTLCAMPLRKQFS